MNSLRNRVNLIGNLGQDPEIKNLENGKKVTRFTLATSEEFIVAWNGLADVISRYLKKGRQVAVEGRIAYRSFEDKNGAIRNVTEIIINDLLMLRSTKEPGKEE